MQKNPYAKFDPTEDAEVPSATLSILDGVASIPRAGKANINRASAAPACPRKRAYQQRGEPGEPMGARAYVNFWLGDLTELVLLALIKAFLVGPGKLYKKVFFGKPITSFDLKGLEVTVYEQPQDTARIGPFDFSCHADGYGQRNSDDGFELIECKSAADFGFERFKTEGPGDYLKQSTVNLKSTFAIANNAKDVRYFYLRKSTGHIWDRLYHFDQGLYDEVVQEAILANGKNLPERPYKPIEETVRGKPTGRKKLFWICSYCAHTQKCWPEAKLEFKSNKPIWVIEPGVPKEATNGVTET